jgi:hypothetical protein
MIEKKQKFAKALEEQRNEIKRRQDGVHEEKQRQLAKIQSDTGSFENDKQAARVQKVQNHAKEKALIEAQIDARKELRERERQAKIESEQRDVARAKRMALEEDELRMKKKEEGFLLTHSCTRSLTHSCTDLLTHLLTYSLTHLLTHL